MAAIFLDANVVIDLIEKRGKGPLPFEDADKLSISPLSVHILAYAYRHPIPSSKLAGIADIFEIIPFDAAIVERALLGPTKDLEDNVQLHSAAAHGCSRFLTNDKQLLSMGYFGTMEIVAPAAA